MEQPQRRPQTQPSAGNPGREELRQRALDDTVEGSFPASDPLSTIPDPLPDVEHTGERKEPVDESGA